MNVLVTRHDKIGDFITVLPLLKILKSNSNHRVIVLVSKVNYDLACEISYIDDVILYSESVYQNIIEIRKRKVDVSISCFIDAKLGLALFFSGIKTRVAPATKLAQIFFNKTIKQKRSKVEKTEWQYNIDLLKQFQPEINTRFDQPLLEITPKQVKSKQKIVAFHPGFGGSSEGNLKLDDYLRLAKSINKNLDVTVVFTFGPDDRSSKIYIENEIDFNAKLIDSKMSLIEFCKLISSCEVFVSTSTGPMHLAGALNIKTLSFFGDSLFASSKRWAAISDTDKQENFEVPINYGESFYLEVEDRLHNILSKDNSLRHNI